MKYLFSILFLLCFVVGSAQKISGLWVGSLYNDSTKENIYYELAIEEQNGKYTAYSYTTFIVNGKSAIGVKSLKVFPQKNSFVLEDDELLFNNYPQEPPKGVKQISSLEFSEIDNIKLLSGKFTTSKTRQYGKQVTGKIILGEKKEYNNDRLLAELDKLGLSKNLSFNKKSKQSEAPIIASQDYSALQIDIQSIDPYAITLAELEKRKVETIETVYFTSDSLRLELYDNGEVDGDSVSVIVNGIVEISKERLSTHAIQKTIATEDSLKIIMFAENLGNIAPNSGLLIIYDGLKRHEIRFEGDLNKNAAIILKRKK